MSPLSSNNPFCLSRQRSVAIVFLSGVHVSDNEAGCGLSVVIPCYNEEEGLHELLRRLTPVCEKQFPDDYEIVLINDGSRDRTWPIIAEFADTYPHVVGINLARNYGHQLALSAGLQKCRGDLILILDADLQDPPELLPQMMAKIAEGHDVVYGQRVSRAGETVFKRGTADLFYRSLSGLTDVAIPRNTGDFRLMTRRVLDQLNAMPERYRFIRGLVSWIGFSQVALPYEREPRFAGETHYPLRKMIAFAIDAVTGFSILPLRIASHLGMVFGICGLAMLSYVGYSYFVSGTVQGWTSLFALVLVTGSVQMMILGVFGEYIGRMYMEAKQRPLYVIQEIRSNPVGLARKQKPESSTAAASDAFKRANPVAVSSMPQ
jgi:glycosyltransferase involved in cell wall biosynthesis